MVGLKTSRVLTFKETNGIILSLNDDNKLFSQYSIEKLEVSKLVLKLTLKKDFVLYKMIFLSAVLTEKSRSHMARLLVGNSLTNL